jgi:signal peptidase II
LRAELVPLNRYIVFFCISIVGCTLDLLTKHWVFEWRGWPQPNNEWWLVKGYLGIETALNPGALFGLGAGLGNVFAILSVVAACGIILWLFVGKAAHDLLLTIALGSVTGGVLGNLYDRLGLWHQPGMPEEWQTCVRDWILFRYKDYTWPNFNIADCMLVCGAGLLVLHAITHREQGDTTNGTTDST